LVSGERGRAFDPGSVARVQERLRAEEQLVADAAERGWVREIERHR
jgi:hypothetical protein